MAALRTIALLGNPYGWYARDLARAAKSRGIELLPVSFEHLETSLGEAVSAGLRLPAASSRTTPDLERPIPLDPRVPGCPDLLLVRSMPMGSLEQVIFRVNALHQMASHGLLVVNSPRSLEIAIDKWLTLRLLQESGLPIPTTICCQTRRQAMEGWEFLGRRCVVKPVFGSEGRGIIRVEDPDIAWRVFGAIEQTRSLIYLQQFLESPGYDLRLLVIDGQVHSVRRTGVGGDWRNNLSRGGTAEPWEASQGEQRLAIQAASVIGASLAGVDLLPTQQGPVLLEINGIPGWKGTAKALARDLSLDVIDALIAMHARHRVHRGDEDPS